MKHITISQTLTVKELTNGSFHSLLYSKLVKVIFLVYSFVVLNTLITIINPYDIYSEQDNVDYTPLIAATLVPLLFIWNVKRQAVNAIKEKGRYYKDIHFIITPEYIKCEGEGYSNTYQWEEIVKVIETKNWYLIYINKQQALILNKSNIDQWQKEELDDVLRLVTSKTKVSLK